MTEYFQCPNIRVDADELLKPSAATPGFIQNDLKTAAPAYERDTVNLLEQLRNTWTAWAVIAAISAIGRQNGRKMTIKPFNKFDKNFNLDQNAYAAPVNGSAATPSGKPIEGLLSGPEHGCQGGSSPHRPPRQAVRRHWRRQRHRDPVQRPDVDAARRQYGTRSARH